MKTKWITGCKSNSTYSKTDSSIDSVGFSTGKISDSIDTSDDSSVVNDSNQRSNSNINEDLRDNFSSDSGILDGSKSTENNHSHLKSYDETNNSVDSIDIIMTEETFNDTSSSDHQSGSSSTDEDNSCNLSGSHSSSIFTEVRSKGVPYSARFLFGFDESLMPTIR